MFLRLGILLVSLEDYMIPCLNKKLFGIDCPGCGLQRSVLLLLKGEFVAAFYMYPAIYALLPLGAVLVANRFVALKFYNFLVVALSFASVFLILTNYILKFVHIH